MIRFSHSCGMLSTLWAAVTLASPLAAQQEQKPDVVAKPQPGFLEIARDPNATAEEMRTVSAMMDFVNETEWGLLIMELRFVPNGVVYVGMRAADPEPYPGQDPEEESGYFMDGRFSVGDDRLEMTVKDETTKRYPHSP